MYVSEVHLYQKDLPVKDGPYSMSGQQVWSLKTTLVRLVSKTGLRGWGGDIVVAAQAHIGATVDPSLLEEIWLATPDIDGSHDPENPIQVVDGHVLLPDGPGLGIIPDESQFGAPIASFGG